MLARSTALAVLFVYKPKELEPTEVTISEFTPNAFTFKQKIASHYARHGKCITQKKLDEKTLDQ